ncbi:MAG: hypothetical protein ACJ749_02545 [Flavisolibacter sp.]
MEKISTTNRGLYATYEKTELNPYKVIGANHYRNSQGIGYFVLDGETFINHFMYIGKEEYVVRFKTFDIATAKQVDYTDILQAIQDYQAGMYNVEMNKLS